MNFSIDMKQIPNNEEIVSRYTWRYRILYISQQRVSDKLRTPGLKRKLKTHTTETK